MRIFLGMLMVLLVSGDEETHVAGFLNESVLLPCNCSERDQDEGFGWQREEPNPSPLLKHNETTVFHGRYKNRANVSLPEIRNNCSVLLNNIKVDDAGKYRCSFHRQGYKKSFVNLSISVRFDVCQKNPATSLNNDSSGKVFQCDAKGLYPKAEIQWKLDGQLLTNSPSTLITHSDTLDSPTGLYNFTSELNIKLNGTLNITCDVKARGASAVISPICNAEKIRQVRECRERYRYWIALPLMLVLGFSLFLWYHLSRGDKDKKGGG